VVRVSRVGTPYSVARRVPHARASPSEDGGHRQSGTLFQFGSAKTPRAIAASTLNRRPRRRTPRTDTPDNHENLPGDRVATGPGEARRPPRRTDRTSPWETSPPTGPSFSPNSNSPERAPPAGPHPAGSHDALERRSRPPTPHAAQKSPATTRSRASSKESTRSCATCLPPNGDRSAGLRMVRLESAATSTSANAPPSCESGRSLPPQRGDGALSTPPSDARDRLLAESRQV
jgi:hypothetical protein